MLLRKNHGRRVKHGYRNYIGSNLYMARSGVFIKIQHKMLGLRIGLRLALTNGGII